jgi:hypothetical protein
VQKRRTTEDDFDKYLPLDPHLAIQDCDEISDDDKEAIGIAFMVV